MRSYLSLVLATFVVSLSAAELPKSATLDEVLALATENGYDVERAIQRLQFWPEVKATDEARIAAAFYASLRATNGNIRSGGAWGLGRRGHGEAIPTIMDLGENDPNLIEGFFQAYTNGREVEPPIDLLRRGLRSKNTNTRRAILGAIANCKASALRSEVETVLASDTSASIRDHAARTLSQLKLPESAPALRRALAAGLASGAAAYGLTQLGSDDDIAAVLPLLKSRNEDLRRTVAAGLSTARLVNSRPACDALLETLDDPNNDVRVAVVQALGHFRDTRALAPIQELISHPQGRISEPRYYVDAISAIGGADAIALLDSMVQGFRDLCGLEQALVRFGSASSARAVWAVYLKDPIRANPGSDVLSVGYYDALDVLAACADAKLLREIQDRLRTTKDYDEKLAFEKLVGRIQTRLNK